MPDAESIFQIISTGGALAFAIWLITLLLREEVVPKGRLEDQKQLTKEALDGWKAAVSSTERLADAWEARNAAEARLK